MSENTVLKIAFIICMFTFPICLIAGIALILPYILSYAWIHNPKAIAPLPYWYAIPCFVASFISFEVALKIEKEMEKNEAK